MDQPHASSEGRGVDSADAAGEPGSDALDALLIAAEPRISARFASLLAREGYRVRVVDTVAAALAVASDRNVDIAFAPASSFVAGPNRRDVFLLRDRLRPLSAYGVPVVVLGDGWESRAADADGNHELRRVHGPGSEYTSSRRPRDAHGPWLSAGGGRVAEESPSSGEDTSPGSARTLGSMQECPQTQVEAGLR